MRGPSDTELVVGGGAGAFSPPAANRGDRFRALTLQFPIWQDDQAIPVSPVRINMKKRVDREKANMRDRAG